MTYNPLKPNPSDFLEDSSTDIQGNFAQANNVMQVNHYPFDDTTPNKGKHQFVTMPAQASDPTTIAGETVVYCKNDTNPIEPNIYMRAESSGFIYQLTKTISASTASFGASAGWTFLPGGLIAIYGTDLPPNTSTRSVNLNPNLSADPFLVFLTLKMNATGTYPSYAVLNVSTTNFTYNVSSVTNLSAVYWIAIGIKV